MFKVGCEDTIIELLTEYTGKSVRSAVVLTIQFKAIVFGEDGFSFDGLDPGDLCRYKVT
jgi:hypothetical protein